MGLRMFYLMGFETTNLNIPKMEITSTNVKGKDEAPLNKISSILALSSRSFWRWVYFILIHYQQVRNKMKTIFEMCLRISKVYVSLYR